MSKLRLDDVEWGEFFIGGKEGVFNISSTKSGIDKNKLNLEDGCIPYVTRSEIDNGINLFISDNQEEKYKKNSGNVITVGLDTQTVFYQNKSFFTGQNIQVLSNGNLNKEVAIFIIPLIKIQMKKFNWGGNGATLSRLNRTKIMLPIDLNGNPNWKFMEDYIKQEMKEQAQKVIKYYENKLVKLGFELLDLEVEWKEFKIKDIFTILKRGATTPKEVVFDKNKYTYIGAKYNNNGVVDFVDQGKVFKGNAICFVMTGEGSVGKSFYKKESFVPSNNICVGYFDGLDEYIANFLVTLINNQSSRYNYGYIRNTERLKNEILMLPIDKNGSPHWQYMRSFMQKLEKENISKVLQYIYIYN